MLDHEEVLSHIREPYLDQGEATITVEMLKELCRVYLAWMDAPTCRAYYGNDDYGAVTFSVDLSEEWKCRLSDSILRLVEVQDV